MDVVRGDGGVAFLCRPFESLFLAPFYLWVLWRLVRRELPWVRAWAGSCSAGRRRWWPSLPSTTR